LGVSSRVIGQSADNAVVDASGIKISLKHILRLQLADGYFSRFSASSHCS